jgi:hypothetical protein
VAAWPAEYVLILIMFLEYDVGCQLICPAYRHLELAECVRPRGPAAPGPMERLWEGEEKRRRRIRGMEKTEISLHIPNHSYPLVHAWFYHYLKF